MYTIICLAVYKNILHTLCLHQVHSYSLRIVLSNAPGSPTSLHWFYEIKKKLLLKVLQTIQILFDAIFQFCYLCTLNKVDFDDIRYIRSIAYSLPSKSTLWTRSQGAVYPRGIPLWLLIDDLFILIYFSCILVYHKIIYTSNGKPDPGTTNCLSHYQDGPVPSIIERIVADPIPNFRPNNQQPLLDYS